jgi:large-conductance mechanosensitive channel
LKFRQHAQGICNLTLQIICQLFNMLVQALYVRVFQFAGFAILNIFQGGPKVQPLKVEVGNQKKVKVNYLSRLQTLMFQITSFYVFLHQLL